jgi:creatinine amidohydrolase
MAVVHWGSATRDELNEILPESVVVLPIGATEQHGPHLPTRTDILIAETVAERAAAVACDAENLSVILAPPLPFGASAHHVKFGGTLSLSDTTLLSILDDLIDSIERQGGTRLLILNGHGGNRGAARAAASRADARESITVAVLDYWDAAGQIAPGHAGEVETSFILALSEAPENIRAPHRDHPPVLPNLGRATYHGSWVWRSIDGYTDNPAAASAEAGRRELDAIVDGVATVIRALGGITT